MMSLNVVERCAAIDDVEQRRARIHAGEDVHIRHAEVGIEKQHALALLRESDREVHGKCCLAHAALAAGHGDDAGLALPAQFQPYAGHRGTFQKEPLMNPADEFHDTAVGVGAEHIGEELLDELNPCGLDPES
jgi:hypothetical protein